IKKGAKLDLRNTNGFTALDIAVKNNRFTVADMIRSASSEIQTPSWTKPILPSPSSASILLSTGTGWVTEGGYIVTNQHVIEGHTWISVRFNNSSAREYAAQVVIADENNDLAVLKLNDENENRPRGLPIAAKLPKIGAEVFTIGYPKSDVMGMNPKVTNGIVSALSGIKDDPRVIQTTVAIQSGNSGGPLLNMKGEVVGITTASLRTRVTKKGIDVPQGVNYAIKSGYAAALLTSVPERPYPMEQSANAILEELIPKVQDSIVQVTVTSTGRLD
ncbi:trypsin-like serine protease, partial [Candidatus Saccharibacteria bacterium]|nr:trypsin-like serine protease [Candidatus Saccharibacteria bacterium]